MAVVEGHVRWSTVRSRGSVFYAWIAGTSTITNDIRLISNAMSHLPHLLPYKQRAPRRSIKTDSIDNSVTKIPLNNILAQKSSCSTFIQYGALRVASAVSSALSRILPATRRPQSKVTQARLSLARMKTRRTSRLRQSPRLRQRRRPLAKRLIAQTFQATTLTFCLRRRKAKCPCMRL